MRLLTVISLLILAIGSGFKNKTIQPKSLNGAWIPVSQELGGKALPPPVYAKERLIIADSTYTVVAESVDKGIVKYNGDNKMDIYGKEGVNAGKHFTAIYKIENGQLTVCYNLKGD